MSDLAIINILYSIEKFNDYEPLIAAIEGGNLAVMKDKTIHKIVVGLLRGIKLGVHLDKSKRRRSRHLEKRDKYLIQYFNIYVTLGFNRYSVDNDEKDIEEGRPQTAVAKLYCFYNEQLVKNDFCKPLAYGSILSIIKESIRQTSDKIKPLGFEHMWLPIYYREKNNIDMSKLKDNVKGTWHDFDIYPDVWEIIDSDSLGGSNNK